MGNREPTEHPTSPAERVCVKIMEGLQEYAAGEGRELAQAVVMLDLNKIDPDEPNGAMYGHGDFEDQGDVLAYMLHHCRVMAETMGLKMDLMTIDPGDPSAN